MSFAIINSEAIIFLKIFFRKLEGAVFKAPSFEDQFNYQKDKTIFEENEDHLVLVLTATVKKSIRTFRACWCKDIAGHRRENMGS